MSNQLVTIDLPEDIYKQYKQLAEVKKRTVEAEILEAVAKAAPAKDKLPSDLEQLVSQLVFLDDPALMRLAKSTFAKKDAAKIDSLQYREQNEGLNEAEKEKLASLMKKLSRWFVLRNEALGLLLQRGHPASEFALIRSKPPLVG